MSEDAKRCTLHLSTWRRTRTGQVYLSRFERVRSSGTLLADLYQHQGIVLLFLHGRIHPGTQQAQLQGGQPFVSLPDHLEPTLDLGCRSQRARPGTRADHRGERGRDRIQHAHRHDLLE
uniref:(northern house mosquito) hypothetical protein n=1 Tax=Culex pipiens TaxID=7175 RepID=A0A8D8BK46_CULPI